MSQDPKTRAIELLNLVTAFVEQNNLESADLTYDEADCDGQCFADDCAAAAEALELTKIVAPGHVALPTNDDEARAMILAGEAWFRGKGQGR